VTEQELSVPDARVTSDVVAECVAKQVRVDPRGDAGAFADSTDGDRGPERSTVAS
jgi:hypothetical protein